MVQRGHAAADDLGRPRAPYSRSTSRRIYGVSSIRDAPRGWHVEYVIIVAIIAGCIAAAVIAKLRSRRPRHPSRTALEPERQRARQMAPIALVLPQTFIVADLETTGLDPERHEIIEIAAIRVHRDSNTHDTFTALIRPKSKISEKITEITGITNLMLEQDGEGIEDVLKQFLDFAGECRLVFYNAPFDMAFLQRATARIDRRIQNPVSDALDMARRALPGMPSYRLSELAQAGGIDAEGAHRALKDCRMTMTVYAASARLLGTPH